MTTDQELIYRAKQGDTRAFEALVAAHLPYVFNVALRTLGNRSEADDISQEAFVRVWRNLHRFRGDAQFRTWLYRIVTNLCYNRLPKLKMELNALGDDATYELPDGHLSTEAQVQAEELRAQLHTAIAALPESYRLLISLRHLQGLSYAEIVEVTDLPLGTVKTSIFRARRALKAQLMMEQGKQR